MIHKNLTGSNYKVGMRRRLYLLKISSNTESRIFSNMEVEKKIIELACSPISEASPCGINAKYEASFELLESEISKSESLNSESTDWTDVLKFSEEILSNTSKDFSVACYLAYAYIHRDSFQGLLHGLCLIEKLSETFWDDMYPPKKRLRGRQNSTQWLIEKISGFLANTEPSKNDMAIISDIAKTLKNLDYFLAEKMEDKAPNFSDITRPIKRLKEIAATQIKAAPEPAKPITQQAPEVISQAPVQAEPAPSAPEEVPQATPTPIEATPTPSASTTKVSAIPEHKTVDVASDADARKAYKQIQESLRKLANYYGQVKASDPKRFRLSLSAGGAGNWDLLSVTGGSLSNPSHNADRLKRKRLGSLALTWP